MAAPTITARTKPLIGNEITEGYRATIVLANIPAVEIYEESAAVLGLDGGEPIEMTNQHNNTYETMAPRHLVKTDPWEMKVGYSLQGLSDILGQINVVQAITVHMPTGKAAAVWGFVQKFKPDAFEKGKKPTASMTIIPTNIDPNTGVEAGPNIQQSDATPGS